MNATAEKMEVRSPTSRHSQRLAELRDAASAIRKRHAEGKISAADAAKELEALTQRYAGFLDRLIGL
jgi:hypothetical protein